MFVSSCKKSSNYGLSKILSHRLSSKIGKQLSKEEKIVAIREIQNKCIWLASFMIHNANNIRPKRDGLKVGGHQASSTSLATIIPTLYFASMRENDRIAIKPHASPIFHSINYLLGNQIVGNLEKFRGFGGVQSYPSKTKDAVDVDFSTGSVGLGAAITTFAAYVQDWLLAKGFTPRLGQDPGRMITLVGDAELDEGNVYEALMESWKLNIRDNWWIIDYNRQSLDKVCEDASFRQIEKMFRSNGWEVITIKYGKKLTASFDSPVGKYLRKWFNDISNQLFSSLVFAGGSSFRQQIQKDIGSLPGVQAFLDTRTDQEIFEIFTDVGGHCVETLIDAFETAAKAPRGRFCFICYTIKGFGLPLAGHKDNHGLFLNNSQIDGLRQKFQVSVGNEWEPFAGISIDKLPIVKKALDSSVFKVGHGKHRDFALTTEVFPIPDIFYPVDYKKPISTQTAFGQVLLAASKSKDAYASRIITMAPDVATSTNLGGFVSNRGVFGLTEKVDQSKEVTMNKWKISPKGQHVELGIAENNLFLLLAAAGLSSNLFGQRIFPVGTLYDPFIARGLDALNYGCYQDSRFLLVSTPAGIALSPEGGAHQSINTPLIGMGQPGLTYFEPTFSDELQIMMSWAFTHMQQPKGGSIYLRLSTRMLDQIEREISPELRSAIIKGAYFHGKAPSENTKLCLVFTGVVYPEVIEAIKQLRSLPDFNHPEAISLLQVTSADLLFSDFTSNGPKKASYIQNLFQGLNRDAKILTVLDGHPATLSWLGSVYGNQTSSLGVSNFGQSGDIPDLFKYYKIDSDAIVDASKTLLAL